MKLEVFILAFWAAVLSRRHQFSLFTPYFPLYTIHSGQAANFRAYSVYLFLQSCCFTFCLSVLILKNKKNSLLPFTLLPAPYLSVISPLHLLIIQLTLRQYGFELQRSTWIFLAFLHFVQHRAWTIESFIEANSLWSFLIPGLRCFLRIQCAEEMQVLSDRTQGRRCEMRILFFFFPLLLTCF